ncbi:MAG: ABC transporter permease subunit, partial [Bacteroidales bacterium]
RDVLSRIFYGSRISLSVGLVGIAVSFVLGLVLGGISGFFGGVIDEIIQRVIEVITTMPTIPLWMALAAALPREWPQLRIYFATTLILSILGWTGLARTVRGRLLSMREEDFVLAAKLDGENEWAIITRYMIPGFASYIIVSLTGSLPGMILGETSLSFLGIGLNPPTISWGVMLQDAQNIMNVAHYPWCITVDPQKTGGITHLDIMNKLAEDNIESRHIWKPMHLQPVFASSPAYINGISEKIFNQGLCLPSGSNMTEEDLERIERALKSIGMI